MSEMEHAPAASSQTSPPDGGLQFLWLRFRSWELRMLLPFFIVYFAVAILYYAAMSVPALGQWRL